MHQIRGLFIGGGGVVPTVDIREENVDEHIKAAQTTWTSNSASPRYDDHGNAGKWQVMVYG